MGFSVLSLWLSLDVSTPSCGHQLSSSAASPSAICCSASWKAHKRIKKHKHTCIARNKKCVCLSLLLPSYQLLHFKASTWKGEELLHLPPASFPLSCSLNSALSVLIALVPSAGLIDQKGAECSSMFAWLISRTARPFFACVLFAPASRALRHFRALLVYVPFSLLLSVFYAPFHLIAFILGSIPDNTSHGRENIYVTAQAKREENGADWSSRESWTSSIVFVFFYKRSVCEGVQH